jgi:hypothetical protein
MSRPFAIIGNVNIDIIVGDCPPTLHPGTAWLPGYRRRRGGRRRVRR